MSVFLVFNACSIGMCSRRLIWYEYNTLSQGFSTFCDLGLLIDFSDELLIMWEQQTRNNVSTSWAGQAVAGVVVFPRSILHIGTWYAIFRHGVDHVPTNNWEAPLFCFAFFFERYDRYNDPKKYKSGHNSSEKKKKRRALCLFAYAVQIRG